MVVQQLIRLNKNVIINTISSNGKSNYWAKFANFLLVIVFLAIGMLAQTPSIAQGPYLEWAKTMGGDSWDNGYAISVGSDRSIYTTGLFRGTADFDPNPSDYMMTANGGPTGNTLFVSKLSTEGNFVWAKKFGNSRLNMAQAIANDRYDNVYVAGYFSDTIDFDPGVGVFNLVGTGALTASDIFILKLTSNGDFVWAKSIGSTGVVDRAFSIVIDSSDNVLISGSFIGTVDFDPGPGSYNLTPLNTAANGFILKLNSDGDFIWAKDIGQTSSTYGSATVYAVAVDENNNVFASGYFRDTVDFDPGVGQELLTSQTRTLDDIFVMKLDSMGNYVWAKSFGSKKLDQGTGVTTDPFGNVYFTAVYNDTVDFDPGPGIFNMIANYPPTYGLAVVKLDSNGNFLWAKNLTGPSGSGFEHHWAYSIKADVMGNTYTTGYFWGTLHVNPGIAPLYSNGASDMFLMKLTPNGDFVWVRQMGGADIDVTRSSFLDNFGSVYTTGWFRGSSDFDPTADTTILTSINNSADIVILKFGCGDTTSLYIADTTDCTGYTLNGITYTVTGVYTQSLSNSMGCDSTITLDLTIIPIGSISITVLGNTLGTLEQFESYQWLLNGQPILGATDSIFTFSENGDYQVVVINTNGCSDTSDIHAVTHLSVQDRIAIASQIKIFPNPASSVLYIKTPIKVDIAVTDIQGRIIHQFKNVDYLSIKDLPIGLYLIRVADRDGLLLKTTKVAIH